MARPSKPAAVIKAEAKSHRTKAELEAREAAEKALLTGQRMQPSAAVKKDKLAAQEYERLSGLLALIDKDDDLYSAAVCRYCLLHSEAEFYRLEVDKLRREITNNKELTPKDKLALLKQAAALDGTLASKRREMLAIEKEMCLTLAASLRAIPKDAGTTPAADPLMELLKNRNKADIDDEDEEVD